MTETVFIPVRQGVRIAATLHAATRRSYEVPEVARTAVIMCHGFPGGRTNHKNLAEDLEHQLSRDGLNFLSFDFRGCGESSGRPEEFTLETALADLKIVISFARNKGYERFFLIGEGLGATVAMMNAPDVDGLRGLIFLWPLVDLKETFFKEMLPSLEDDAAVAKGSVEYDGLTVGLPLLAEVRDFRHVAYLNELAVPLLIQHGDADTRAPHDQLELIRCFARNAPRMEITTYQGGDYGLLKPGERKTLYEQVRAFVKRYI